MDGEEPGQELAARRQHGRGAIQQAGTLLAVLAVCAAVRVWLIAHTETISPDGTVYVRMAREWLDDPGGVIASYNYHVAYPAMLAAARRLLTRLGGPEGLAGWTLAGQVVSLVASLAAIAGVWVFAGMAFGPRVAWVTALLFGIGRKWATLGADVLSDAPAVCAQVWTIVLGLWTLRLLRRDSRWAIGVAAATGACAGCGYLVRPEALLACVLAVLVWLAYLLRRRVRWPTTLASAGAAAVAAAACAAPYMLAIGGLTKKKRLTDLIPFSLAPPEGGVLSAGLGQPQLAALRQVFNQIFEAMHPLLGFLAVAWIATWVGVRVFRLKLPARVRIFPRRPAGFVMAAAAVIIIPMMTGLHYRVHYLDYRHVMFLAALLSPLGGAGLVILATWVGLFFEKFLRLGRSAAWAAPLGAAMVAGMLLGHTARGLHAGWGCHRQAGRFIRARAGAADYLVTDSNLVLHYAERPGRFLRAEIQNADGLLHWIRRTPATYLALTGETLAGGAGLAAAVRGPVFGPLRIFTRIEGDDTRTVHVFRIRRDRLAGAAASRIAASRPGR